MSGRESKNALSTWSLFNSPITAAQILLWLKQNSDPNNEICQRVQNLIGAFEKDLKNKYFSQDEYDMILKYLYVHLVHLYEENDEEARLYLRRIEELCPGNPEHFSEWGLKGAGIAALTYSAGIICAFLLSVTMPGLVYLLAGLVCASVVGYAAGTLVEDKYREPASSYNAFCDIFSAPEGDLSTGGAVLEGTIKYA